MLGLGVFFSLVWLLYEQRQTDWTHLSCHKCYCVSVPICLLRGSWRFILCIFPLSVVKVAKMILVKNKVRNELKAFDKFSLGTLPVSLIEGVGILDCGCSTYAAAEE